jgi:hypothetical protein
VSLLGGKMAQRRDDEMQSEPRANATVFYLIGYDEALRLSCGQGRPAPSRPLCLRPLCAQVLSPVTQQLNFRAVQGEDSSGEMRCDLFLLRIVAGAPRGSGLTEKVRVRVFAGAPWRPRNPAITLMKVHDHL